MRKRIVKNFTFLIILAIFLTFLAMEFISYQEALSQMKKNTASEAVMLADLIDKAGTEIIGSEVLSSTEDRITLVRSDGTVLLESDENASDMENHLSRPEIQSALSEGRGEDLRVSSTFGTQYYYYAVRLSDGSVLRVSGAMDTVVREVLSRSVIAVVLMLLLIALELLLVRSATNRIVDPINNLDLEHPLAQEGLSYPELMPLLQRMDQDHRAREAAEQVRREFSANVSHELKTPLMSISGYAELIENGMVRSEDIPEFAGRIRSESTRLKNLVEDIIRLSRLEEAGEELNKEQTDLYEICEEVKERLSGYAAERNISFVFSGIHARIFGVPSVLREMIFNLCDNAIKYSLSGGSVELSLSRKSGTVQVSVADTGIGISEEEQERIFERFYRVDKSHSRETGGTGLGLSIVKHGAQLHDAGIGIQSALGKGTTITVSFPE